VFSDLTVPDVHRALVSHMESDDVVGVRQIVARLDHRPDLTFAKSDLLNDPAFRAGLAEVHANGLSFDLQMYPEQAADALRALDGVPDLPAIIDHALCPYDQGPDGYKTWSAAVDLMASRPKTFVKLSGWGMYDPHWAARGTSSIRPYVEKLILAFGPTRVMWGSNYPVEKIATPYPQMLEMVAECVPLNDQAEVFRHTAVSVYFPGKLPVARV